MWKVDIYLETDSTFQGKRERKCGYVLSTMVGNEEKTKENFGISKGTYHQSVLMALIEALSRMNVSSEICVHTQDSYVASRLLKLEEMAGEGWRDSKGELIKNAAEWEQVYRLIHAFPEAHKMTARSEKHSYSNVNARCGLSHAAFQINDCYCSHTYFPFSLFFSRILR